MKAEAGVAEIIRTPGNSFHGVSLKGQRCLEDSFKTSLRRKKILLTTRKSLRRMTMTLLKRDTLLEMWKLKICSFWMKELKML